MGGAGKCDARREVGGSWTGGVYTELQQEEPRRSAGKVVRWDCATNSNAGNVTVEL